MTAAGGTLELVGQCLGRGSLRHTVGHVEEGRHTTCRRCLTLAVDVGLGGQSGFTEVYVVVDDTWQHIAPRGVDDVIKVVSGER